MHRIELPSSRAVRAGLALFALGLVFIGADVVPFFFADRDRPLWLNLACLLAPLGFAIAVWSGLRAGRLEQREALRELAGR
jgi:peptidoglycan/LPS O-acetylase OafA/YrhL